MSDLRITGIEIRGLKGTDGTVELDALNYIGGGVGSGKSRVLDAVRMGILGRVPSVGRKPEALGRLMSGNLAEVRMTLSDGRTLSRMVTRSVAGSGPTAKTTYKLTASASWLRGSPSAIGKGIRELAGETDVEAAECLDVGELLAASPLDRAKRIEALLDATTQPAARAARAKALALCLFTEGEPDRVPTDGEECFAASKGMLAQLGDDERERVAPVVDDLAKRVTEDLAAALDWANQGKRRARDGVQHVQAAYTELEDEARQLQAPAATLAEIDAEVEELRAKRTRLRQDVERTEQAAGELTTAREAAEAAGSFLAALPPAPDREATPAALEAQAADLDAQAAAVEIPPEAPRPELPAKPSGSPEREALAGRRRPIESPGGSTLRQELEALVWPTAPELGRPDATESTADTFRRKLASLDADPWQRVAELADQLDPASDPAPERSEAQAVASELRDLVATHQAGDPEQLREDVQQAEEAAAASKAAWATHQEQRTHAETEAGRLRKAIDAADAEHLAAFDAETVRLTAEADEAEGRAGDAWVAECGRINGEHAATARKATQARLAATASRQELAAEAKTLRERAARERDEDAQAAQTRRDAEEAHTAATGRLEGRTSAAGGLSADQVAEAGVAIDAATTRLQALAKDREAVEGANVLRQTLQRKADELALAQVEARAFGAGERALQRIRAEDLGDRATPLTSIMARFLEAAGVPFRPYLDAGPRSCDFGWKRDGKRIPVEAMSGGEAVLFGAALAAAVITRRGRDLRVLLVEAAEIGTAAAALFRGLAAVGDELGTVIVATCVPVEPPPFWNHVDMGAGIVQTAGEA